MNRKPSSKRAFTERTPDPTTGRGRFGDEPYGAPTTNERSQS